MSLIYDTLERLQICMSTNSIYHCGQTPQSCSYFQRSAEGILPQPHPPINHQRNNGNENQNRQEYKCCQQQQKPRYLQQDRTLRVSGGRECGPQPLENKTGWIYCRHESISRFNLPRNLSVRICKRHTAM